MKQLLATVHDRRLSVVVLIAIAVTAGAGSSQAQPLFSLVSDEAGIDPLDTYNVSSVHGLGINWIDFDGDNWADIFVVNGIGFTPDPASFAPYVVREAAISQRIWQRR